MNIHIVKKERCVNWTTYILFHIFNYFFSFFFSLIFTFSLIFLKSFSFSYFILLLYSFPHLIPTSHASLYSHFLFLTSSPPLLFPSLNTSPHFPSPHPPLPFLLLNLEKKSACTLHECLENGCIFDYLVFGVILVVYITNKFCN